MSRLGRWIDFEKDYKTLYPWFMETIWCVGEGGGLGEGRNGLKRVQPFVMNVITDV